MLPFLNSVESCLKWLQQPKILQSTSKNKKTKPILYAGKFFNLWQQFDIRRKDISIYQFKDDIVGLLEFYNNSCLKASFGHGIIVVKKGGLMSIINSNESTETIYIYQQNCWKIYDNNRIEIEKRPRRITLICNVKNGIIDMKEYQLLDVKQSLLDRYINMLYDKKDILMLLKLFKSIKLHLQL